MKQVRVLKETVNIATEESFEETLQQFKRVKEVVRECHEDSIAAITSDIGKIRDLLENFAKRIERIERRSAGACGSKWKRPGASGASDEEPTLHELFNWFQHLERRINAAVFFKWPEEKHRFDECEEVDRAYLALRSAVEAKNRYWHSLLHLHRFVTYAYEAFRKEQGLPLSLVEVAQSLTAVAREAYFREGPDLDPVDGDTLFWWSDVEYLERHLERLHWVVEKSGVLKEDSNCDIPCFMERVGRALFYQRAAENLVKATADWNKYELQDPKIQDLVGKLEWAVQLGRRVGREQREAQRAQAEEEEEQRIDEPKGEEAEQEIQVEESAEEGGARGLSVQDISSEDLNNYVE